MRSLKRIFSLFMASWLLCSFAIAEEEAPKGFLDSVGGWFTQAWDDTSTWVSNAWDDSSSWVSQAWTDTTTWVSNAWGDSSRWVSQAWNDSSKWVSGIWGDVSTWAVDSAASVGKWLEETFNKTTPIDEAWTLNDTVSQAFHNLRVYIFDYKIGLIKNGDSADKVTPHDLITPLLSKLRLNESDANRILETIRAYSEEKGLSVSSVEAIMLPYLLQMTIDSESLGDATIPAIAVAQYLTGTIEKLGVKSQEEAQSLEAIVQKIIEE